MPKNRDVLYAVVDMHDNTAHSIQLENWSAQDANAWAKKVEEAENVAKVKIIGASNG